MRLRTLLSITHALVVLLFVGIFLAVFFSLSKPPEPRGSPDQTRQLAAMIDASSSGEAYRAYFHQFHLGLVSIDLFDSRQRHHRLLGRPQPLSYPTFGSTVAAGKVLLEFDRPQWDIVQWMPIKLADGQTYVLRLMTRRSFTPWFAQVVRNLSVSLAIALAVGLTVAWAMARRIARPANELARLTDRFGRESLGLRAAMEGPTELAELAGSFNVWRSSCRALSWSCKSSEKRR